MGCGEIHKTTFNVFKRNAKLRDIEFDVSIEYIWKLFLLQNRRCAITGEPIEFGKNSSASLDRINNSRGYIKGNVWWVHKKVNSIKNDMSLSEMYSWCEKILQNKQAVLEG
jgi:hypothetical protein